MELKPDLNELKHHGVKGMHWGTRKGARAERKRYNSYNKGIKIVDRHRLKKMTNASDRSKYVDAKDAKWMAKVNNDKNIQKVSKRAASEMKKVNKQLKEEYGGKGVKGNAARAMNGKLNAEYHKAMKSTYEEVIANHTFAVYKLSPSRTREVEIKALPDGTLKATIVERHNPKLNKQRADIAKATKKLAVKQAKAEAKAKEESLKHSDQNDEPSNLDGMFFIIKMDSDGFPDDVISPFELADDSVQHSGVKGMRWGVRHDEHRALNPKDPEAKQPNKIQKHARSLKRERQWKSVVKEMDKLSTKDIQTLKKRVDLENDLKTLVKSPAANKKERELYLHRHDMSNDELQRKINRLRAKHNLHESVNKASKEQREFGRKVVQIGGTLGVKYALNKKLTPGDFNDAFKKTQETADKAQKDAVSATVSKTLGKINKPRISGHEQNINDFINSQLDKKLKPKTKK